MKKLFLDDEVIDKAICDIDAIVTHEKKRMIILGLLKEQSLLVVDDYAERVKKELTKKV